MGAAFDREFVAGLIRVDQLHKESLPNLQGTAHDATHSESGEMVTYLSVFWGLLC